MSMYNPLHLHSYYSLLDGASSPKKIAARVANEGMSACAISDHGNLAACVKIQKEFKAKNIKPIFGCELYICDQHSTIKTKENGSLEHLVVLSKNLRGWKDLLKLTAFTNQKDNFYRKPRLSKEQLYEFVHGNFVSFSGHPGSQLANILFDNPKLSYRAKTHEDAAALLHPDHFNRACKLALELEGVFGKGNFYIEIQLVDAINLPAARLIAEILRCVSKATGIPCVATADSHYVEQKDATDQRVLLCSALQTTLIKVSTSLANNEDVSLGGFFKSNRYHIPSPEEMAEIHRGYEQELANSLMIADMCEKYSILNRPLLPEFQTPPGFDAKSYLRHLCDLGFQRKIVGTVNESRLPEYRSRLEMELATMEKVDLSAYFLVVEDYIRDARANGEWVGLGRGSAGGCIISYLLDIIGVDPVENDLYFERFYNDGRNTPDKVSFPDIDTDFETANRHKRFSYIRNKYGRDKTGQVATYSRLMGRGALKEVLRAHEACSFDEMNRITEYVPDEAMISDKLEEMRENSDGEDPSIIQWALENHPKELSEWCTLNDDGTLSGPLANYFAQAKRIEGTRKAQSKHASALIVSRYNLDETVPMIYDKSGDELIIGIEGVDAEDAGLVKFDILGNKTIDRFRKVAELVGGRDYRKRKINGVAEVYSR